MQEANVFFMHGKSWKCIDTFLQHPSRLQMFMLCYWKVFNWKWMCKWMGSILWWTSDLMSNVPPDDSGESLERPLLTLVRNSCWKTENGWTRLDGWKGITLPSGGENTNFKFSYIQEIYIKVRVNSRWQHIIPTLCDK